MKNYLCHMLRNWKYRLLRHAYYVICDPEDNSVTLSRSLFKHMGVLEMDAVKIFVFRAGSAYGFMVNPEFDCETQLADIQYNGKHHCVGFECLVPTVNRIFYDYGLPHDSKVKLSVKICRVGNMTYYQICPPKKK